jgi:hypothetical protein
MIEFRRDKPPIEQTPQIDGLKCKLYVYSIFLGLSVLPLIISIYFWMEYDLVIAIGMGLFLYFVSAIIGSKLRQISIPLDQTERSFSSFEIASWYVKGHIVC